jgi:hypothetical protein
VLNAAWDAGVQVASENALPCYDRDGFNKTLENAKPRNDPDGRHLFGFTYLRLCGVLFERPNFMEFERFVKRMHGTINRSLAIAAPQFTSCIYTSVYNFFWCSLQVKQFSTCRRRLLACYIHIYTRHSDWLRLYGSLGTTYAIFVIDRQYY